MPNILQHELNADREFTYRRGYVHGVGAVISGLVHNLSEREQQAVDFWFQNSLFPWSKNVDTEHRFLPPDFPRIGE